MAKFMPRLEIPEDRLKLKRDEYAYIDFGVAGEPWHDRYVL